MRAISTAAACLALSLATLVTGCSDGAGSTPEPAVSPTPSPSPSSTPALTPTATPTGTPTGTPTVAEPTRPSAADTRNGRIAFAHYVVDAWGYALNTNNAQPLLDLSPPKKACDGCSELEEELRTRGDDGWRVDFPGAEVGSTRLSGAAERVVATMNIAIPASDSYNADGSYRNSSPAHPDGTFVVEMRFVRGDFHLLSFTIT